MPKFRKKPVVVEAVRYGPYTAPTHELILLLMGGRPHRMEDGKLIISTLEGDMVAEIGDWIIKGVAGECYPCKPDIFAATYEEASDE